MKRQDGALEYPTSLTDDQWELIRHDLPQPSRWGRRRTVDRRQVLNAIFYVLRTGCAWRMLPHDFPRWKTVYGLFLEWRNAGIWQQIHDHLRTRVRRQAGKQSSPSAGAIDSQSVKTTDVGGERGYDGGKKINGRKRHLIVDTLGLLLAVVVHPADWQDQDGAVLVFQALALIRTKFRRLRVIFADSAYGRSGLPGWVQTHFGWLLQTVLRPVGLKGFQVLPKRWIVERTFAWLSKYRRHSKDYERNTLTSETMIYATMTHIMLRRLAPAKT
jgi:putative transposase